MSHMERSVMRLCTHSRSVIVMCGSSLCATIASGKRNAFRGAWANIVIALAALLEIRSQKRVRRFQFSSYHSLRHVWRGNAIRAADIIDNRNEPECTMMRCRDVN